MKLGRVSSYHFSMPEKKLRRLYNLYDVHSLETELSLKKSHGFNVECIPHDSIQTTVGNTKYKVIHAKHYMHF